MARKRVLVAMSGGVDSSVAALLLVRQGYEVIGVTLNLWSYEGRLEPYNGCCSLEVRAVAQQLGIEHHFLDGGALFREAIVEPFLAEYASGRTPSPCGHCNRRVRFPLLLEAMERWGCEYLATGHHARLAPLNGGGYVLKRGADPLKDQSYFLYGLYGLGPAALGRIRFPVGGMRKEEVWATARAQGLVSARKPESQDLCFLPGGDYRAFLRARMDGAIRPGEIVDPEGNVLGRHDGLPFYTVGQRRGLGVNLGLGRRAYVVALDPKNNRVIVGPQERLYAEGLIAEEVCFAPAPELTEGLSQGDPIHVQVKVRSRSPASPARLEVLPDGRVRVTFAQPQRAITPGQLIVFYRGEAVLGGGVIAEALRCPT